MNKSSTAETSQRLESQTRMIEVVAHDLRDPLSRLDLAADLAEAAGDDHAMLVRSLDAIRRALVGLRRLVEDLDDFAGLQAGEFRLCRRPLDPVALVRAATTAFASIATAKQIELVEHIGTPPVEVVVDEGRLHQVISNLLTNALCATPPGGRVSIAVDGDREGHARFDVSDSGPGIDAADLPHVFERHWRGSRPSYHGRGLGLSIARDLVECHGGRIDAHNAPGGGASISFTIPPIERCRPI